VWRRLYILLELGCSCKSRLEVDTKSALLESDVDGTIIIIMCQRFLRVKSIIGTVEHLLLRRRRMLAKLFDLKYGMIALGTELIP
jgi:hypothetical protein